MEIEPFDDSYAKYFKLFSEACTVNRFLINQFFI